MFRSGSKILVLSISLSLLVFLSLSVRAQEMKEAATLYNAAAQTFKQNPVQALKSVEQSIKICEALNTDESNNLKATALKLLPKVHVGIAGNLYKEKKVEESLAELRKAVAIARENKDAAGENYAVGTLANVLYRESITSLKLKAYDKAIAMANESFSYKEKSVDPLLVIAEAQDSLKQYEQMLATYEKGLEIAKATNNLQRMTDMRIKATNYLKRESQNLQDKKKYDDAVQLLNRSVRIDERDAEVYSALAVCFKAKNESDSVIYNVELALKNAPLTMDKTQLFFLKAQALQAQGKKEDACLAYKEAAVGSFKESAEHQMKEVLKCK